MSAEIPDRWRDEDCWPPPTHFDYVDADSDDSLVALPPDPATIRSHQIVPTSSGLVRVARGAPPLSVGEWYREARKHGWPRRKALIAAVVNTR